MKHITNEIDCSECGLRLETIMGSYKKQTLVTVEPYCANPDCVNFDKTKAGEDGIC